MKHIIIGGSCRAGKSLLAKEILKKHPNLNYISIDTLRDVLTKTFNKDYKITYEWQLREFAVNLFNCCLKNNSEMFYMLEGANITVEDFLKFYKNKDTLGIFVGKPNISEQEFFIQLRKNEILYGSYTKHHTDTKLRKRIREYIKRSQEDFMKCKDNGILFLDTSFNQMEQIEEFVDEKIIL